jgi:hypothetical protein
MPKSRRRTKRKAGLPAGAVQMTPEMQAALLQQRDAFRKEFGRDPGPGDPVFFDPDADEPKPLSEGASNGEGGDPEVLEAMRKAGVAPEFLYAYRKTGLIGVEGKVDAWPPDRRKEWEDAVKEFFLIEEASKRPDRPDPSEWKTEIPELLVSPFTKHDLAQVHECLSAIAPIEARGMKVVTQIELAAALMAAACEHAYVSGEEDGERRGPSLFSLTEQLVVRRAREIYAQGSAGED